MSDHPYGRGKQPCTKGQLSCRCGRIGKSAPGPRAGHALAAQTDAEPVGAPQVSVRGQCRRQILDRNQTEISLPFANLGLTQVPAAIRLWYARRAPIHVCESLDSTDSDAICLLMAFLSTARRKSDIKISLCHEE